MGRKLAAEFVGTFLLVFLAVGAAVVGLTSSGNLAVAASFGLVLAALVYALGPTSGAHVNPAVSLAMALSKRQEWGEALAYMVAQVAGAIVGAGLLKFLVDVGDVTDETGALGTNSYGDTINVTGAFVAEVVLTAAFVAVILLVTDKAANAGFAGVAIGAALAAVHLVGIPMTGTSVNPARSIGPALLEGGDALSQLWLFILAPMLGGAIAVGIWMLTRSPESIDAEAEDVDLTQSAAHEAA